MRVIIQRVSNANVKVEDQIIGKIGQGYMVLTGIEHSDTEDDAKWLANKICNLRIFDDDEGVMNKSILEVDGNILAISQFTLHAKTKKGNRPSYINAARPEHAEPLFRFFVDKLEELLNKKIETGKFGAAMKVELINDGPVTILIDTKNKE